MTGLKLVSRGVVKILEEKHRVEIGGTERSLCNDFAKVIAGKNMGAGGSNSSFNIDGLSSGQSDHVLTFRLTDALGSLEKACSRVVDFYTLNNSSFN
ncbi:hypothetical protein JTE90_000105 [Oedothorax gibbosus]|uniref:Uncharacterized protein n=1 Tax=Oedothorax gibbosus TaxID=931172 RepID=A0AAV6V2Z6_9ARAC|nr:hypothetical protein JTE90_000105 [Oedothorax gibbosus]